MLARIFDAPRALVFEAWTKPEHLKQWSAPHGFTVTHSEGVLEPDGPWRAGMRGPDGFELLLSGVYQKIVPGKLLVFTHAWHDENDQRTGETTVTVRFADIGTKTKVTLTQGPFESVASRDGHSGGWSQCLERLSGYLVTLKTPRPLPSRKARPTAVLSAA